jgi:antirestriction protein
MTTPPRIYVACLASYNAGTLHGRWIDAAQDPESIAAEVSEMLSQSAEPGAEEWAIHDYEGFGSYPIGEYESLRTVAEIAAGIEEYGPAFAEYFSHRGGDPCARKFQDAYLGEWGSLEDYAAEFREPLDAERLFCAVLREHRARVEGQP